MRLFISALALLWVASIASADSLSTVNWANDTTVDGTGNGVLNGTNNVTYSTAVGFNAGTSLSSTWESDTGTAAATGGSVSSESGGVLGGGTAGSIQTITFSQTVANPVLLVNFLGGLDGGFANDSFDFGSNSFILLSSFNATASGNTVSSTNAVTDSANDGFGLQFTGTFGPANPLQFTYTSDGQGQNGLQSVGFTIGTVVPEPSTMFLLIIGATCLTWRSRKFGG